MSTTYKILIIRFSSIGDIVLTTPVIRCLKVQLPEVELHFLTKKQYIPLLAHNPHIKKIYSFEKKINEIIHELKKENFNFIVDLQKNRRSLHVRMRLCLPFGTLNKLNKKKWLLTNFKINLLPNISIVDRYFLAVKKLNVHNDYQGLDYFIPAIDRINIKEFLPKLFQDGYITLVAGSKQVTKQIPVEKMIEICRAVKFPVILLGDNGDREKANLVSAELHNHVFNACGNFNINQSASFIEQAQAVITTDTGLMHIAAALRKKIISVWGNTVNDLGMFPYYPKGMDNYHVIEVKNLKCRPCSKLGYKQCPKKHFRCMMDIDAEKIAELINI